MYNERNVHCAATLTNVAEEQRDNENVCGASQTT